MRRLLPLALTLLALYLAACSRPYTRPGVTQADADRDSYECWRESQMLPKTQQSITRGPGGSLIYADPTLGSVDAMRSSRMQDACLRARGYRQE